MEYWLRDNLSEARGRIVGLDFLRFFAAVMVMIYHFTASGIGNTNYPERYNLVATQDLVPALSDVSVFGFLGVNLFFLISGFVIFSSALNRAAVEFATLRFIRLYPVYWLSIIFTLLLLYTFLGDSLQLSLFDVLANLTMVQPYLGVAHLDPVYWTLLVELHFYAIIFLALLLNQLKAWRLWTMIWLVCTYTYTLWGQPFFLVWIIKPQYSAYFIAGMVMYSVYVRGHDRWTSWMLVFCFFNCCMNIPEQISLYNSGHTNLVLNGIGCGIIAMSFILMLNVRKFKVSGNTERWLIILGGLTYPLYLTHHQMGRYLIDALYMNLPLWILYPVVFSLCLVVAWLVGLVGDRIIGKKLKLLYFTLKERLTKEPT